MDRIGNLTRAPQVTTVDYEADHFSENEKSVVLADRVTSFLISCFLIHGNMCVGTFALVRLDKKDHDKTAETHRPGNEGVGPVGARLRQRSGDVGQQGCKLWNLSPQVTPQIISSSLFPHFLF